MKIEDIKVGGWYVVQQSDWPDSGGTPIGSSKADIMQVMGKSDSLVVARVEFKDELWAEHPEFVLCECQPPAPRKFLWVSVKP